MSDAVLEILKVIKADMAGRMLWRDTGGQA